MNFSESLNTQVLYMQLSKRTVRPLFNIRPPFIRISLLSERDLAVIFFFCVQ